MAKTFKNMKLAVLYCELPLSVGTNFDACGKTININILNFNCLSKNSKSIVKTYTNTF